MTTPYELITILDRIIDGKKDKKDIALLRQWLENSNNQNLVQSAKYIVNTPDSNNIHIGDNIVNEGINEEAIAILRQIQEILKKIGIETATQANSQISLISNISPPATNEKFIVTTNAQTPLLPPATIPAITKFEFEVVTIDTQGIETKRCLKQAESFIENLADGIILEMVSIAGGKFQMGAPQDEFESLEDERPQHIVALNPFFIGKYPITQAQWRVIAKLPKIKRRLELEPSCFKGDNLPVERVSWYDAQEFCERISRETGRKYRLPSEAEWEYTCRAQTSTPFHFGKIITTNLANYCGHKENIHAFYHQQTIEVGNFPANAFGLCDMHGLVWEWCDDYEHEDYQGAPLDGSVWLNDGNEEYRILRGGSWDSSPSCCRSASRFSEMASVTDSRFGFRVVCNLT
ncbi:SUMF1/EgtB/PvdO family nonheme iron enzyme [Nostoc sp. ChiQUE01b]|uniref:SUMF1/EgtB/PvdO family nonheme iron enzyme n=1 Tax=Nostoc sp. ChiQUE01b TaxID=3075376 RepID=UPI002AD35491|nr:SUMF1/EgtB/PvdO family nonheme iron enzyme [Nostoc sp. ChiQUE01b]MDZ8256879.1 SUMF1/EgtB/PvdO family nonheme iron enzyme [Nostoc sp. ChiQUE01b]